MNDVLHDALRNGRAPFNGLTLFATKPLQFVATREVLLTMATLVRTKWPEKQLLWCEDWHEHDSYKTGENSFKLERVEQLLASPEVLASSLPGDDDVRLAVYPESHDFLWRFGADGYMAYINGTWHLDEVWNGKVWVPRRAPEWYVDFTAAPGIIEELRDALGPPGSQFEIEPAKSYFDRRAAP